ncbi:MAG: UDP-glucose--hexose-1-phosphate uridylyltransferase [Christensenellales bacterium]|jgi:UDPglucose--hexose-1-phosphate uridylyltransferase
MLNLATETMYRLLDFAQAKGLAFPIDRAYHLNRLLEVMEVSAPEEIAYSPEPTPDTADGYLNTLAECAVKLGVIGASAEIRDLFMAKVMGVLTPSPAEVREKFAKLFRASPETATNWFYGMCRDNDSIKVSRIAKNIRFVEDSPAGKLEITINLSKPEKDPRDIAAQRQSAQNDYPKCLLCPENSGYAGRLGFPARQNHRMVPVALGGERWFMQYSPYLYYNEHCIVLNESHTPMKMGRDTFVKLFDFVAQFPHYFIGSNADLPIVGGSILNHDHFQGGAYRFPMDDAGARVSLQTEHESVAAEIVDWPMNVIRLRGTDREAIIDMATRLLDRWVDYSDPARDIHASSGGVRHNAVTPILRLHGMEWKLDLVLRNNRTTHENPLGIFHPHEDLHHIKKENIGLIEVMGMFVLPGRLVAEFDGLEKYLTGDARIEEIPRGTSPLRKHYSWITQIAKQSGTALSPDEAKQTIRAALAQKCWRVLADCGVFKDDAGMLAFLETAGFTKV